MVDSIDLVKETKPVTVTFARKTDEGDQGIDRHDATFHGGDIYNGSMGQSIVGGKNNQNNIHNGDITIQIFQLSEGKAPGQAPDLPVMDEIRWKELYFNVERNIAEGWDVEAGKAGNDNVPSRRIVIYTGIDIARKKLKAHVEIVFTLTPSGSPQSRDLWPAIVWKTLKFPANSAIRYDISWYGRYGFCSVEEQNDMTLKPGDLATILQPKHVAVLQYEDEDGGLPTFSPQLRAPINNSDIAVFNKSPNPWRFALCTIDPTRPETDQFLPVVDVGSLQPDGIHLCGTPIMLQAFIVRGYQERNPIDVKKLTRPLFLDDAGKPKPIDISKLNSVTSFRLYSNLAGKVILDKD